MSRRALRISLIAVAAVVGLVVIAGVVLVVTFDPNTLKPRIVAAVKQATGRDLALNGSIGLKPSLWPTVQVRDVAFANPPGLSRPDMATLGQLDLQMSLLPLLRGRVEIDRLVLVKPAILLETDKQGRPNWEFSPPAGAAPQATPAPSDKRGGATPISFRDIRIEGGTLTLRDDRSGKVTTLALKQFEAKAETFSSSVQLTLDAVYNGVPIGLGGEVGPLARLQQPEDRSPWPVKLQATAGTAKLAVDGTITQPLQGRGYRLALDGNIPDVAALAPLLPGVTLPPLRDLRFTTQVADSGGPVPTVSALTLHLGASDLGAYVNGLQLATAEIAAPKLDQPIHIAAQAKLGDMPLGINATVGAPAGLLSNKPGAPATLDVSLQAANSSLTVKGSLAHPEALAGADLAINGSVPDLAALSPLARQPLPALTNIAFAGRLTDAPGGLQHGAMLRELKLTMPAADLSGELGVANGAPPSVTGKLHSDRVDADALLAAMSKPGAGPSPGGAPAPARPAAAKGGHLIPDTPIPFGLLRTTNADLGLSVGDLKLHGGEYRAIALQAVLRDGKLRVDPITADLPQGKLNATLSVDATQPAPAVALTLQAPGLAAAPLLKAAGLPGYANGKLEVHANLHGAGGSPHAIAASLDGSLGVAMQGGNIDAPFLSGLLGPVLQQANLLTSLSRAGSGNLRCLAVRADAQNGIAELRTLVLDSSLMNMDGSGSVNLRDETLALRLRPQGSVAGAGLVVPLRVTGSLRAPSVAVDALGAAESNAGTVAGAVIAGTTPLGLLGGAIGGGKLLGGGGGGESCAGPLALARLQTAPAAGAPAAPPAGAPRPKVTDPGAMLRQLFH